MRRLIALMVLSLCVPALLLADEKEDAAVKALTKLGAKVQIDKKSGAAKKVDLRGKAVADDHLKHVAALPKVQVLDLGGAKGKDDKYLPKQITDKGLAHLANLTGVRELVLDGTHVTDAGLKHLANMKDLQKLILSATRITDEGLKDLAQFKKLISLWVDNTKVTKRGVLLLQKELPKLDVLE
ncbi:MAG TPA: hypothetical protein VKD72_20495 [Gemmataceae bacterium]|nr:hypothetical protein [Gemmataceae bacterium]